MKRNVNGIEANDESKDDRPFMEEPLCGWEGT